MKIAVIGCGPWGLNHIRALIELDVFGGAVDISPGKRLQVSKQFRYPVEPPHAKVFETTKELIDSRVADAVVVATPPDEHVTVTQQCLRAGLHVLCEKPLALDFKSTKHLSEMVDGTEQVLMAGHIMAYNWGFGQVQDLIASGIVGEVRDIYSCRLNLGRVRSPESVLWSSAIHDVDMILRLMNWEQPKKISVSGGAFISADVEDSVVLGMSFSKTMAHIYASWHYPYRRQELTVCGSTGAIVMDDVRKTVDVYRANPVLRTKDIVTKIHYRPSAPEPLIAELQAFIRAIETNSVPASSHETAVEVARVLQRAQEQLRP